MPASLSNMNSERAVLAGGVSCGQRRKGYPYTVLESKGKEKTEFLQHASIHERTTNGLHYEWTNYEWVERVPTVLRSLQTLIQISSQTAGRTPPGEMTTPASPTACVGLLRPMRFATSAKHGMRILVMKP